MNTTTPITLLRGDCLEILPTIADKSIDAVICDLPYGTPPGTIKHCKEKGVEVFAPTINFFDLVKKKGAPTMRARFCCGVLKEYKVHDRAAQPLTHGLYGRKGIRAKQP